VSSDNPKAGRRAAVPGWEPSRGWGWIWGEEDEVGALNAITSESIVEALQTVTRGKIYDLGVPLDRTSFLWPGHVATEVIGFRTPAGIKRKGDLTPLGADPSGLSFHTSLIMVSDHAGTQLDGLCHATFGADDHWYNGFKAADWSFDFGPGRAGAENIPPILATAVLIDVPRHRGVDELDAHSPIEPDELKATLEEQGVDVHPGEACLIRTGSLRHWGEAGADHGLIAGPDTAGITLASARWLCEEKGAMVIGTDTSTVEVVPAVDGDAPSPVHKYLLVDQGVHMGELHYLEELAAEKVYRFCYVALVAKLRGVTAGFAMRPVALV
jgi:kynurenine formamidase